LGLYRVLETLLTKFPHILFEGCSGGGGRFDAGMLYYTPQIWCSDDTDAIERLTIQYGTSFGYPVSAMGSHVSDVSNHQTKRITPFSTRGCVAMAGTFGFELGVTKLSGEEKEQVKKQICRFKQYYDLIQFGEYYRLMPPSDKQCTIWEMVDTEGREALISAVYHHVKGNAALVIVKVRGLNAQVYYQINLNMEDMADLPQKTRDWFVSHLPYRYRNGEKIIGAEEALLCWKDFFDKNKNWRDFSDNITYKEYKSMTDKQHLSKAKAMPIKFLKASGKGFFIDKERYALAIREDLGSMIKSHAFCAHMGDILEYRTMDYYRRRYRGK
jgi:hypothetical protein